MIWTNFAPLLLMEVCSRASLLFVSCPGIVFDLKFVHITLLSYIIFSCSSVWSPILLSVVSSQLIMAILFFWVVSVSLSVRLACVLMFAINICMLGFCFKVKLTNIWNKMFKKHSGRILHCLGLLVIISVFLFLSFLFFFNCLIIFPVIPTFF